MSKPTINTQHTASYAQLYELLSVAANAIKACISKKDLEDANRATAAALVQLSEQTANNQTAISGKVDKVLGKGLSQNDFTDDLKARLEGLNNYNDTEVRGLITSLQSALDTLSGTNDTTDVIDSMNEIKAFLDKFKNNTKLSNVLATLEETIHTWVEAKGYLTSHQDISGKADVNHTHSEYADVNHTHSDYASKGHNHDDAYASKGHNHDTAYAAKEHTHSQYLTQHQSLDGKADKSEVDTLTQVISAAIVQLAEQIANNTTALTTKVDKVSGKGLSQNDYSDEDKSKLAGIDPTSYADKNHSHTEYVSTTDSRLSDSRPSSDVYTWAKLQGSTTATSVENIPVTHRLVVASLSANATFSLASVPVGGIDIHVIIRNTGSSDITITLPTEGNYLVGGDDCITIEAGKFGEVSAVSDGTTIYLRGI